MAYTLSQLEVGDTKTVTEIHTVGSMRRRLLDLGVIEGTKIECIHKSPCGDPIAYNIRGAIIALRIEDSKKIFVS